VTGLALKERAMAKTPGAKSEGTDALSAEIDAIMAELADHEERIAALEANGGIDPNPPEPEPDHETAPRAWDDPRFTDMNELTSPYVVTKQGEVIRNLSVKTTSGEPAVNSREGFAYTLENCRFDCKEGPRISGPGTYAFTDVFVQFLGEGDDHADGIQDYGPGNAPTVVMTRVGVKAKGPGANNASVMFVDNARANVTLDSCDFDGAHCPSKGLFIANVNNDNGVSSLKVRNTVLRNGTRFEGSLPVQEWTNVTDGSGKQLPRP
jgi:hypothetical protein